MSGSPPKSVIRQFAEALLNRVPADTRFEVLNFGIIGLPTVVQRDVLLAYKTLVEPDLIVVGFCFNDPQPREMDYSIEKENLMGSMTGRAATGIIAFARDAGFPYLSRSMRRGFYGLAERAGFIPVWQDALQRSYEPSSEEWRGFVGALKDIRRISDERRSPAARVFGVESGPGPVGVSRIQPGIRRGVWRGNARRRAQRGISDSPAYNHEHEIRGLKVESLWINVEDAHPNANVNRVYGEKLYRTISDMLGMRR